MSLPRRRVLCLAAGLPLLGCRPRTSSTDSSARPEPCPELDPDESWIELPLSEWPELAQVGIGVPVDLPEHFATLLIVQEREGCYLALWRICTHGACEVVYEDGEIVCPCHDSRFGPDGEVLQGPATRALVAWEVGRTEESVWLRRPEG